jgi:hypothetical protein
MRRRTRQFIATVIAFLAAVTLGALGTSGIAGAAQSARTALSTPNSALPPGRSAAASSGIGLPGGLNNSGAGVLSSAVYYDRALRSKLWMPTPDGLVYRSCRYTVPDGSTVDSIRGRITLPTGAVRPLRRCAYPMLSRPGASSAPAAAGPSSHTAGTDGWLLDFSAAQPPSGPLASVTGNMAAPSPPNELYTSVDDFAFTAFQDYSSHSILQPIIGWGGLTCDSCSNDTGPYLWMASTYAWGGSEVTALAKAINPGDTIHFSMSASNCNSSGGGCSWFISMVDYNTSASSAFTVVSSPSYYSYTGGAFESYNATDCNMLFGNGHLVWRDLSAQYFSSPGHAAAYSNPSFEQDIGEQPCGMYAINYAASNGGDILWTP